MRSVEFEAPVVESLSVRVVVDSVFDQFIPKATHPTVTIEHVGRIRSNMNSTLAGEWGLSLHLESRNAGTAAQYLLDFGYTPEVLLRNFSLLGIEPERLDGLILSHGHRDHYGGVARLCRPLSGPHARRSAALCRRQGEFSREVGRLARRGAGLLGRARPRGARSRPRRDRLLRCRTCPGGPVYHR